MNALNIYLGLGVLPPCGTTLVGVHLAVYVGLFPLRRYIRLADLTCPENCS